MTSITTVGKQCGDMLIKNVLCDNIKIHKNKSNDDYTLTFAFSNNCGLLGLLFNKIRSEYRDAPTFMVQASVDFTVATIQVSKRHTLYVRRHQTLCVSTLQNRKEVVDVSPGKYSIEAVAKYNPVLSAVLDVNFRSIHVADQQCCTIITNAVLHGGVEIRDIHDMETSSWFPDIKPDDLCASKHIVDGIVDFEENRHVMVKW
jgi:hypothetical protein